MNGSTEIITILATLTLAIDRFVCIKYPFHYQNLPNYLRYIVMFLCWLLGTIYCIIGIVFSSIDSFKNAQILYSVFGSIVLIVLFVSNTLIFKETQRHIKAIAASITYNIERDDATVPCINSIESTVIETYTSNSTANIRKQFIRKKEIRAAYICIYMTTSCIVFWAPFYIFSFVNNYTNENLVPTIYLVIMNSIVDPIIYILFHGEVRSFIIKRLNRIFQRFYIKN